MSRWLALGAALTVAVAVCVLLVWQRGSEASPRQAPADPPRKIAPTERVAGRAVHIRPKHGTLLDLPIKALGNFDYDASVGGGIPEDVLKLEGVELRTYGYMVPVDQADHITQFALVPSLFACCYGQPPTVQHTIVVHCPPGSGVSYYDDQLVVKGTLHVQEKKEDGVIASVFELDCTSVKPAAK